MQMPDRRPRPAAAGSCRSGTTTRAHTEGWNGPCVEPRRPAATAGPLTLHEERALGILLTIVGLVIVLATLRDITHELFDPEDVGSMSRPVMHGVWRLIRVWARHRRAAMYHAGHIILISVAAFWTILLTVGWALVFWPRLPQDFHIAATLPWSSRSGFDTALYVSLTSLTTLGSSDIVPLHAGLRFASAVESLLGVGMITAWITWILSIYPVLSTRRSFEREIGLLQELHPDVDVVVHDTPQEAVAELLRSLAEQMLRVGSDLSQSRVTYYFQNRKPEISLTSQLPYVLALAHAAESMAVAPALRHRGALLRRAVESTLADLGTEFLDLHDAPPDVVLRALARDHMVAGGKRGPAP